MAFSVDVPVDLIPLRMKSFRSQVRIGPRGVLEVRGGERQGVVVLPKDIPRDDAGRYFFSGDSKNKRHVGTIRKKKKKKISSTVGKWGIDLTSATNHLRVGDICRPPEIGI